MLRKGQTYKQTQNLPPLSPDTAIFGCSYETVVKLSECMFMLSILETKIDLVLSIFESGVIGVLATEI